MAYTTTSDTVEVQPGVTIHVEHSKPTASPQTANTKVLTLVFLHFWGGSSSTWRSVIPVLANTYRTVALDFRGWGESTGPYDEHGYSIRHLADDVEAIIKHYNLSRVVLIGHSMGAKVAQLVAARNASGTLRGLFLVAPAPPTPLVLPEQMREQQIHAYDNAESAEFVTRNVLSAGSLSDATIKLVVKDMLRGNRWAKLAWPRYGMAEDIRSLARQITVPVSILASEADRVEQPDRIKAELVPNIGSATSSPIMAILPGVGHLMPLEAAGDVGRHMARFLLGLSK